MKHTFLILSLLVSNLIFSQNVVNEENIKFIVDNSNLQVIKLNSDSNATSFAILIKESIKPHYHENHTESVMVLDGEAEMRIGDSTLSVKKGDFFVIPQKAIHSVQVISKEPFKIISIQAPEFHGEDRVFIK